MDYLEQFTGHRTQLSSEHDPYTTISGSWVQELKFNPWQHPNNISRRMERMARAMTNVVRSSESRVMLDGQAYQTEPYISIQWGWLAFSLTLLVLSLVFPVSTIVKTSGDSAMGNWKHFWCRELSYSFSGSYLVNISTPTSSFQSQNRSKLYCSTFLAANSIKNDFETYEGGIGESRDLH